MKFKFDQIAINSTAKKKPEPKDAANYVGLEHLTPGTFEISEWGSNVAPVGEKLLMKKGDVLFGRRRAYQRKVGIAPFDGIFSAHGMVLRPRTEVVDENYFPFFISSDQFMNEAVRISVGSLSPTINWGTLKNCEFDLPPMEEQKKLAELLWAANDLKEKYKKAITATDEMLKAKFREMFGCVGNGERGMGNEEDFNAEAQRRRVGECEGCSRKGTEAWNEVKLGRVNFKKIGEVFDTCSGGTPSSKKREYYENGTIPWMNSSEVAQGIVTSIEGRITELGLKNSSAKLVPINSVVVAMYGATAGKVGLLKVETTTNQAVCSILPNDTVVPEYLYFAISALESYMAENAKGAAQPNISQSFIREMEIPLPPLSLQREFVAIAEKAETAKAALKKSIADIDQVMKGLINR